MNAQSEDFTALHDFSDLWVNEFPEQWEDSLRPVKQLKQEQLI